MRCWFLLGLVCCEDNHLSGMEGPLYMKEGARKLVELLENGWFETIATVLRFSEGLRCKERMMLQLRTGFAWCFSVCVQACILGPPKLPLL